MEENVCFQTFILLLLFFFLEMKVYKQKVKVNKLNRSHEQKI